MSASTALNSFRLSLILLMVLGPSAVRSETPPRFPSLPNAEAWKSLPRTEPALPAWALVLVKPLPKTTGAMLELDRVHRTQNPLGAVFAGKLRWAAADALGCSYARSYAEADLRRAGVSDKDLQTLKTKPDTLSKADQLTLLFARQLTLAGHAVTDAQVAELLNIFGPESVVAMIHTIAYANFQNRIFLALGVSVEQGGPLPPIDVEFDADKRKQLAAPSRMALESGNAAVGSASSPPKLDWRERDFDGVQQALSQQKARKSRIPMPDPSRLPKLPESAQSRTIKIAWSHVSMGYQPLLTKAWFDCMHTFDEESNMDQVFANTAFWVVTRSNECFY